MKIITQRLIVMAALVLAGLLGGCSTVQTHITVEDNAISLKAGQLQQYGLAFITPSTVTGQEEDKQALAFIFTKVLAGVRPKTRIVTLPETLSAINRAGLAEDYKRMFNDYRDTGIFNRDMLQKVREATGTRYIAQLKMANFNQESDARFGALGFRIVETKKANLRLFVQIWDAREGTIAWEATQELHVANETLKEEPVAFRTVVEVSARDLIARLP
jgi:hypothetical protein